VSSRSCPHIETGSAYATPTLSAGHIAVAEVADCERYPVRELEEEGRAPPALLAMHVGCDDRASGPDAGELPTQNALGWWESPPAVAASSYRHQWATSVRRMMGGYCSLVPDFGAVPACRQKRWSADKTVSQSDLGGHARFSSAKPPLRLTTRAKTFAPKARAWPRVEGPAAACGRSGGRRGRAIGRRWNGSQSPQ